jgi:hypothetical protein
MTFSCMVAVSFCGVCLLFCVCLFTYDLCLVPFLIPYTYLPGPVPCPVRDPLPVDIWLALTPSAAVVAVQLFLPVFFTVFVCDPFARRTLLCAISIVVLLKINGELAAVIYMHIYVSMIRKYLLIKYLRVSLSTDSTVCFAMRSWTFTLTRVTISRSESVLSALSM